ncbi:LON peptidase substrate-binding domain-containing protein [Tellurirhabdus rosea]|uniref:LON peptidase substrate-binding domain-containing protein n=1 Tax=Tellurirhabdus rosea TaxID=2674997 RepID=UPI00225A4AF5|nr:LON peptidase substrate-binding domain-containing protein [Tellurirhabdus rosea]
MDKYLPLFPLNLVVYPDEELNLHIFEQRYRQLVNECLEDETTFGIPAFINNKMPGYGTEMRVTALHKRYEDGRMDIKTKGVGIFRLIDYQNPTPGKLYAGGQVETVETPVESGEYALALHGKVMRLYELLKVESDLDAQVSLLSFRVAHKIGLSVDEEYELLTIETEDERQQYLIRHLDRVLPIVSEMEKTKDRIRMNGHFKNLDPLNF